MKQEIKEFDGEKYVVYTPESEKEAVGYMIDMIKSNWGEKSETERITDYIFELLDRNTKQVRKEVVQEIREKIMDYYIKGNTAWFNVEKLDKDVVCEILDQIQGETK